MDEEASLSDIRLTPNQQKAEALQSLAAGRLASSIARLSASSRAIPSDKEFHFYNNFDEFKLPVKKIAEGSESLMKSIGSSSGCLFGRRKPLFCPADDADEAYEWLVDLNDEVYERIDTSMDEFHKARKKDEASISGMDAEDGFQLVLGKKKKRNLSRNADRLEGSYLGAAKTSVKLSSKDHNKRGERSRVPFHIPTIPRPQDEFKILVNNSNEPFAHVWLQKSDDGSRFIHPLEKLSVVDFVDRSTRDVEATKPLALEATPFHFVEDVQELKALAAKLRGVDEFAVDLEHNQYRSFQGLTCLMQISTRNEDYVVDTLKLRIHIGPYLREAFKDPNKRKVMHGADKDIIWLQRDFGIYVCNLFDTGQASRTLQMERNSLEYLLLHFCGVTANKEYQNADWRLRPLPADMIKYAREDTHYLLYIYDLMRAKLMSSSESGNEADLLMEVYKRSFDICLQLYEKELFTDSSYLYIYGLQGTNLNAEQLAIVSGLYEWRDAVAREEDESTGYILPNKSLLEIARKKPLTSGNLRQLLKSKHPFVERNLGSVVNIIKRSIGNAAAFESAFELLKRSQEAESEPTVHTISNDSESLCGYDDPVEPASTHANSTIISSGKIDGQSSESTIVPGNVLLESLENASNITGQRNDQYSILSPGETRPEMGNPCSAKAVPVASVQLLKKPSRAFGALLGNPSSKRIPSSEVRRNTSEKENAEMKLVQIKASVTLPFHSFAGSNDKCLQDGKVVRTDSFISRTDTPADAVSMDDAEFQDIIPLENDGGVEEVELPEEIQTTADDPNHQQECSPWHPKNSDSRSPSESDIADGEAMTFASLSSSFQECFRSISERKNLKQNGKGERKQECYPELEPYDYAAARKLVRFNNDQEKGDIEGEDTPRVQPASTARKGQLMDRVKKERKESSQPRRRQAFPSSGNRSATFH